MDSLIHFSQHVWCHTCCDNLCGLACMRVSFDVGAGRAFVQAGPSCTMATYHTILASFTETAAGARGNSAAFQSFEAGGSSPQQRAACKQALPWRWSGSPSPSWEADGVIQVARRGGVETSNACRGPRQNYRMCAPHDDLSSERLLRAPF